MRRNSIVLVSGGSRGLARTSPGNSEGLGGGHIREAGTASLAKRRPRPAPDDLVLADGVVLPGPAPFPPSP